MINKIDSVSFKAKIIDSHAHIGKFQGGQNTSAEQLNELAKDTFEVSVNGVKQTDEIEYFLVSNLECMYEHEKGKFLKDEITGNKELLEKCEQNPKLKAELVCEPKNGNAKNIDQLLQEYNDKVFALKFHPQCSSLDANHPSYEPYMQIAKKHNKPCVFHSDRIDTFASPLKIYELAKKTPEVPVVLYHMSMASGVDKIATISHLSQEELNEKGLNEVGKINGFQWQNRERWNQDGIDVVKESLAKKDANLYLETSWTKPETVVKAIKEVGEDRVLFGTDAPLGDTVKKESYAKTVSEVKTAIKKEFGEKADGIINKVFFENAQKVFIKGRGQISENNKNSVSKPEQTSPKSKNKYLPFIIAGGAVLAGIIGFLIYKSQKNKNISSDKS